MHCNDEFAEPRLKSEKEGENLQQDAQQQGEAH